MILTICRFTIEDFKASRNFYKLTKTGEYAPAVCTVLELHVRSIETDGDKFLIMQFALLDPLGHRMRAFCDLAKHSRKSVKQTGITERRVLFWLMSLRNAREKAQHLFKGKRSREWDSLPSSNKNG